MKSHEVEKKLSERQTRPSTIALEPYNYFFPRSFMQIFTTIPLDIGNSQKRDEKTGCKCLEEFQRNADQVFQCRTFKFIERLFDAQSQISMLIPMIWLQRICLLAIIGSIWIRTISEAFFPLQMLYSCTRMRRSFLRLYRYDFSCFGKYIRDRSQKLTCKKSKVLSHSLLQIGDEYHAKFNSRNFDRIEKPRREQSRVQKARPRVRYLFLYYWMTMLKRSCHNSKAGEVIRDETSKLFGACQNDIYVNVCYRQLWKKWAMNMKVFWMASLRKGENRSCRNRCKPSNCFSYRRGQQRWPETRKWRRPKKRWKQ